MTTYPPPKTSIMVSRQDYDIDAPIAIAYSFSLSPLSSTSARNRPFSFSSSSLGLPNSTCTGLSWSAAFESVKHRTGHSRCIRHLEPSVDSVGGISCVIIGYKLTREKTHDLVGVHDRLQAVRNCEQGHVLAQLCAEGRLDDRVRLVICPTVSTLFMDARTFTRTNQSQK